MGKNIVAVKIRQSGHSLSMLDASLNKKCLFIIKNNRGQFDVIYRINTSHRGGEHKI